MTSSGAYLSVMTMSNGSFPVLVAIALTVVWWLDDLGEQSPPDDGTARTARSDRADHGDQVGRTDRADQAERARLARLDHATATSTSI